MFQFQRVALVATITLMLGTAKVAPASPVRLGVLAGVDFGTLSTTPSAGSAIGRKMGLAGGVAVEVKLTDFLYFQQEVAYVQQGATANGMNFNYNTLKVPLFLKFQREVAPSLKVFALFGPSVGIALSRTVSSGTTSMDVSSYVKGINFALDAGVGAEYAVTPAVGVGVSARYSLGLTNILNTSAAGAQDGLGSVTAAKTRDFQLLAHVFFSL